MGHININLFGRFGNQMFQYAFARAYAAKTGSILHTNEWLGQKVFNLKDEPIRHNLRKLPLDTIPSGESDVELFGYFQNSEALSIMSRTEVKKWFDLRQEWHRFIVQHEVTAHIRHGDYRDLQHIYCVVSREAYFQAFRQFGYDPNSVVIVSEETTQPNGLPDHIKFIPDFITLMFSRTIFRGNSSFSWWAATLSNARILSPLVEGKTGSQLVEFVDGNWPRLVDNRNCGSKVGDLHLY